VRAAVDLDAPPELLADKEPELVPGGSLQSRRNGGDGKTRVTYRWTDPHTIKIVRWRGDVRVVDRRSSENLYLTAEVDPDRMKRVRSSLGIPTSWFTLSARTRAERDRKVREIKRKAAARGITVQTNGWRVNHKWVVEKSREDMKPLAWTLSRTIRNSGYRTQREALDTMAAFVQSMTYRVPADTRRTRSGKMIRTGGVTMPIETLYRGHGDCDTKSLLFASILANFPRQRVIFLMGKGHLFVGVRGIPRLNDHHVDIRGTKYILMEMTSRWPVGRIPLRNWANCGRNVYKTALIVDTTAPVQAAPRYVPPRRPPPRKVPDNERVARRKPPVPPRPTPPVPPRPRPTPRPPRPDVPNARPADSSDVVGTVGVINPRYGVVTVDIASGRTVREGMLLDLFRGDEPVGQLRVLAVLGRSASGTMSAALMTPRLGDKVKYHKTR